MEVLFEEVLNYLDELRAHDASAPRLSNAATWADDWSHGNIWAIANVIHGYVGLTIQKAHR